MLFSVLPFHFWNEVRTFVFAMFFFPTYVLFVFLVQLSTTNWEGDCKPGPLAHGHVIGPRPDTLAHMFFLYVFKP
jgi:hypothetical protein